MPGDSGEGNVSDRPLSDADSLLKVPTETIEELEGEAASDDFSPAVVAQLPKFLRSFFLRFLDETVDLQIERFSAEESDRVSDYQADLEADEEEEATWSLLFDFVDLCDYFDDFGLMSVPDAAQEHQSEIFGLTARVLFDLGDWAEAEAHEVLAARSRELAKRLEALVSGAKAH
jgi:hypothetical protein